MPLSLTTRALLILTALNLLDYLDRFLVASLGPLMKADLGLSNTAFGFLGTAFILVYFVTSPLFGYLGDRWGRLRLMAGGAVLWSLATSLTFWVPSYPFLVAARGLVGVGEASFGTLAPAYLADLLPLRRRSRALGLFYLALPLGAALAYMVGKLVGSYSWGWRPAFLLAGLPGLAMAGLIFLLREVRSEPATGATVTTTWSPLTAYWGLFKVPTLRRVTLGYGMVTFALGGLALWMPIYLHEVKGLTLAQANQILSFSVAGAGGLGILTGGFLGSRLLTYTLRAPLWVSGLGIVLALPLAAVVIFVGGPGALYSGPGRGDFPPVPEPRGAHRGGGERGGPLAPGPGRGSEHRGHSPGGRCAFPPAHRLGLGPGQPQMGRLPHPGGPGCRGGVDLLGAAPP